MIDVEQRSQNEEDYCSKSLAGLVHFLLSGEDQSNYVWFGPDEGHSAGAPFKTCAIQPFIAVGKGNH